MQRRCFRGRNASTPCLSLDEAIRFFIWSSQLRLSFGFFLSHFNDKQSTARYFFVENIKKTSKVSFGPKGKRCGTSSKNFLLQVVSIVQWTRTIAACSCKK